MHYKVHYKAYLVNASKLFYIKALSKVLPDDLVCSRYN